jgi:hypothetical protein
MQVSWIEGDAHAPADAAEYDAFVLASPAGHPSQTRPWAEVARGSAHVVPRFALVRDAGRVVGAALVLRPSVAGVRLPWAWVERGPVVHDVSVLAGVTRALGAALRRRGVAWLRVMPYWSGDEADRAEAALRSLGLRDVQAPDGAHACTLRVGLAGKSDGDLLAGGDREQLRRRIRQAERTGAVARRGHDDDWPHLRAMHRALMEGQGKRDKPDAWWDAVRRHVADDARGALFACDHQGRTVAAAIVLRHGPQVTFGWGASTADDLPFSKSVPALVAAMRWARDVGCTRFDLGGVPLAEDHDPKRNAIARFKHVFDPHPVRLVREHGGWVPVLG